MIENSMLNVLARAERELPFLVATMGWSSLDVDYEPPRVERVWTPFEDDYRLYLHRIHPCERALYHPHPWPSAIKVVTGGYQMAVGFGAGDKPPPVFATIDLAPGSTYEMNHIDGWHSVLPKAMSLSIMVTGRPWARWAPPAPRDLKPLSDEAAEDLLQAFRARYCP